MGKGVGLPPLVLWGASVHPTLGLPLWFICSYLNKKKVAFKKCFYYTFFFFKILGEMAINLSIE